MTSEQHELGNTASSPSPISIVADGAGMSSVGSECTPARDVARGTNVITTNSDAAGRCTLYEGAALRYSVPRPSGELDVPFGADTHDNSDTLGSVQGNVIVRETMVAIPHDFPRRMQEHDDYPSVRLFTMPGDLD